MIGEDIILKTEYIELGNAVLKRIEHSLQNRFTISIGGESGSGKSTLAMALKKTLDNKRYHTAVLHMDDYFHRPPADTHNLRLEDTANVGLGEVNLPLIQKHIIAYKEGAKILTKPLVHFQENKIASESLTFSDPSILIIEGTYVTGLKNIDAKVFLTRNFKDTYEARMSRGRDQGTNFVEEVLAIEHQLIAPHSGLADILIDKNYQIIP